MNQISRLKFAAEHVIWTEEQWDCVHLSDESKINLFVCEGRMFVRRSPKERHMPQCTKSSVEFGGRNVMVFGMNSAAVRRYHVRLHGKKIHNCIQTDIEETCSTKFENCKYSTRFIYAR